jgi:hypothetical protein
MPHSSVPFHRDSSSWPHFSQQDGVSCSNWRRTRCGFLWLDSFSRYVVHRFVTQGHISATSTTLGTYSCDCVGIASNTCLLVGSASDFVTMWANKSQATPMDSDKLRLIASRSRVDREQARDGAAACPESARSRFIGVRGCPFQLRLIL